MIATCHRYGIYTDKMANVYVRNSRFSRSTHADIWLAASAGNSIRRSVSQGSAMFIGAPGRDPGVSNPTVIEDNRVDGWTSPLGAIRYGLRGPVTAYDNQFTNGPAGSAPIQPSPPLNASSAYWILQRNWLDGSLALASSLVAYNSTEVGGVKIYDIDVMTNATATAWSVLNPALPPTPITPETTFLKPSWPEPTKIFDATTFGALADDGLDDTAGIQGAVDAAAKAGNGAMAYIPVGTFNINTSITITGNDFWVAGSGFNTIISTTCPPPPPPPTMPPTPRVPEPVCSGPWDRQSSNKTRWDLSGFKNLMVNGVLKSLHVATTGTGPKGPDALCLAECIAIPNGGTEHMSAHRRMFLSLATPFRSVSLH